MLESETRRKVETEEYRTRRVEWDIVETKTPNERRYANKEKKTPDMMCM